MAYIPIGDGFENESWEDYTTPYADIQNLPDYDPSFERGQRFGTPDEVARWAIELGIDTFTYIIEYPDGSFGPYVTDSI